jgi:peptidoglycan L-alanyl-D-glutamate endopeptidase CwlK
VSRRLEDLDDSVRAKVVETLRRCADAGVDILTTSTERTAQEQARLYRQGRPLSQIQRKADELSDRWGRPDLATILLNVGPQYGRRVTNAGPGQSMHNYRLAHDGVPMRDGKPVWSIARPEDRRLWDTYGACAEAAGLEWAGRWVRFREFPHVQEPGARWQELIRQHG